MDEKINPKAGEPEGVGGGDDHNVDVVVLGTIVHGQSTGDKDGLDEGNPGKLVPYSLGYGPLISTPLLTLFTYPKISN